ncbi:MAG: tripartite tricarboxylate transporter substrate binding protein [Betaproteobacteria bacterium]|nr:tripartite tricarboxylate transporter substrate binding protein [Betaproteobacteria bacterium]
MTNRNKRAEIRARSGGSRRRWLGAALAAAGMAGSGLLSGEALAQDAFPGKAPIELVVLFPAGSSADVSARILADGMSKDLGVPVTISNKPGGGGTVGYKYVASSRPIGHVLVWNSNSVSTTFHSGTSDLPYTAFAEVARVTVEIPAVVVMTKSQWKTLPELIKYAKANPGMLKVGNSGVGSHTHMAAASLFEAVGAQELDVPFGSSQVVPSLVGGFVDALVQLPSAVVPMVNAGQMRVLAVLGSKRDPVFPKVPTAIELGLSIMPLDLWRGIAVTKNTPKPVIDRLEKAVHAAVETPEFKKAGVQLGFVPAFAPAADFSAVVARDDYLIARQMKILGLAQK